MAEVRIATLDGSAKALSGEQVASLGDALRGELLTPGAAGYDEARSLWNAMIDRRPALVVKCAGTADVIQAVKFVAAHQLRVAIRGAGHNIAGSGVCDDGVLIDLSGLRSVHVNPEARTVRVEPGVTLGDLDHETQAFGLATPVGINSTTGIAGLTLGGGFGWLSRKHGLTIDNLRSVDVITADGTLRQANADTNADLFWALRGGGGNFGVVTSFEFDLHPVGPEVLSGLVVHPLDAGREVLDHYRKCVADHSDELCVWTVVRKAPPLPFLPTEWHGREVVILAACYAGDLQQGERELAQLRDFGKPIADVISPHPFAGWQQAFDPLLTPGARNYWKSHNFTEMADGLLDVVLDFAGRLPSDQTEIFFARLGGAINRVPVDATAYPHRDAEFVMNVHTRWAEPADDEACVAWAREFFAATEPHATGGVYVNFIPEDEERVTNAYGPNYARLQKLKSQYDPTNLFRVNQNISG
ncbi:MAG: FAD-binding oxidoreductase [Deltaproteobacteria bacterium]|nr:FAD-binding oxidoreductase [Deltaproteobacteria bacterium]